VSDLKDFNFWTVVVYLLPGLLMLQARCLAARGSLASIFKDSLTAYLIVTVLYSLVLWTAGISLQDPVSILTMNRGVLIGYFVLAPLALGFAFGLLESRGIVQRFFIVLGINVPLPIDTAWAEIFSRMQVGTYLIVLLKDGTFYNAMVTTDSRFGSDPANIDLFLGQTFHQEDWTPYIPARGVYIRGSELKSIEIIHRP
jgi:hypothetical protein